MERITVELPQLGESVVEGTVGRWLKQVGDSVQRDEPLVEIQTDKVNAEVPSPFAGRLERILVQEGATVPVKTAIAEMSRSDAPAVVLKTAPPVKGSGGEALVLAPAADQHTPKQAATPPLTAQPASLTEGDAAVPPPAMHPTARPTATPAFTYDPTLGGGPTSSAWSLSSETGAQTSSRRLFTPVVLRMAQEHGVDLAQVTGTGLGGRVTRRDVEAALASAPSGETIREAAGASLPPTNVGRGGATADPAPTEVVQALTPMRRAIASHMAEARRTIPDAWCMVEIDVSALVALRAGIQQEFQEREGFELTYLPFFLQAVIEGLKVVPALNATWVEGQGLQLHRHYNLGIAASVEQGLVVPALRDADQFSLVGLARASRELVRTARAGRLKPADLEGATFTVNNPGALGSVLSQAVVPVGQAGIVSFETIVPRVVVVGEGLFGVRQMMNCCLSFDHRILDGAGALRFLTIVKDALTASRFALN